MFKYLNNMTPAFWDKLIAAVIEAIKTFADNQEAQAKFFTSGDRVLRKVLEDIENGEFISGNIQYTDKKTLISLAKNFTRS